MRSFAAALLLLAVPCWAQTVEMPQTVQVATGRLDSLPCIAAVNISDDVLADSKSFSNFLAALSRFQRNPHFVGDLLVNRGKSEFLFPGMTTLCVHIEDIFGLGCKGQVIGIAAEPVVARVHHDLPSGQRVVIDAAMEAIGKAMGHVHRLCFLVVERPISVSGYCASPLPASVSGFDPFPEAIRNRPRPVCVLAFCPAEFHKSVFQAIPRNSKFLPAMQALNWDSLDWSRCHVRFQLGVS